MSAKRVSADNSTSFIVDGAAPLGRYTVAVALDKATGLSCGTLQLALPARWKLSLSEFSPGGTFDVVTRRRFRIDTAWTPQ